MGDRQPGQGGHSVLRVARWSWGRGRGTVVPDNAVGVRAATESGEVREQLLVALVRVVVFRDGIGVSINDGANGARVDRAGEGGDMDWAIGSDTAPTVAGLVAADGEDGWTRALLAVTRRFSNRYSNPASFKIVLARRNFLLASSALSVDVKLSEFEQPSSTT